MFETLESRADTLERRALRQAIAPQLSLAGAVSPRVIDVFLLDYKAQVDPKTGDYLNLEEGLSSFRTQNQVLFNPPKAASTETAKAVSGKPSPRPAVAGLPDLKALGSHDRRLAVRQYVASLRRG
jgi:hypothetical protein